MLSNVLPGLREIRAPLTAGYIWLITAWLLFHSSFPTEQEAEGGPLEPFFDLGGVVSAFGLTVVLSVLAYLIGSMAGGVFRIPLEAGARVFLGLLGDRVLRIPREAGPRVFLGGPSWKMSWKGLVSLEQLVQGRVSDVIGELTDEDLFLQQLPEYKASLQKIEMGFDSLTSSDYVYLGVMPGWGGEPIAPQDVPRFENMGISVHARPTWVLPREVVGLKGTADPNPEEHQKREGAILDRTKVQLRKVMSEINEVMSEINDMGLDWTLRLSGSGDNLQGERARKREIIQELLAHQLCRDITNQIADEELPLVGTRLLGRETDLFHEFDRQKGESEFRLVIIPSLLALTIVLALKVHFAYLLMLCVLPLFYWQGVRHRQAASDVLIDSLLTGRVEAPAIEKLERAAKRATARKKQSERKPVKLATREQGTTEAPRARHLPKT